LNKHLNIKGYALPISDLWIVENVEVAMVPKKKLRKKPIGTIITTKNNFLETGVYFEV